VKVQTSRHKARQYAIAMLLEAAYVMLMAGLALLVALVAEWIIR
jgi:hypothetical protein